MTEHELLQQALDALKMSYELQDNGLINFEEYKLISDADILIRLNITIEAIKARLAQPDAEAVAWVDEITLRDLKNGKEGVHLVYEVEMVGSTPLFEYLPEKEWVGLTDEERNACLVEADPCEALLEHEAWQLMVDIEAKLKEKNT